MKDLGHTTERPPYERTSTMDFEQTFGEAARRSSADWYADQRLRSVLCHWEAKDLMRSPDPRPRDLVPMPWRTEGRKTPVRNGYIVGTRAEVAAEAMGLVPLETVTRPFGQVCYVEGPKPTAKERAMRPKPDAEVEAIRRKADGGHAVVLSDHEMMKALGIQPIGYLD